MAHQYWTFTCPRHCSMWLHVLIHLILPMLYMVDTINIPFYRWEHRGTEKLINLAKAHSGNNRVDIQIGSFALEQRAKKKQGIFIILWWAARYIKQKQYSKLKMTSELHIHYTVWCALTSVELISIANNFLQMSSLLFHDFKLLKASTLSYEKGHF